MTAADDLDVCWHCHCVLMPEPAHCDQCPPPGECDVLDCDEPGCTGECELGGDLPTDATERARYDELLQQSDLRTRLHTAHTLLRRVIDDGNDPASLRALARDIAVELGVGNPLAQN